MDLLSVCTNMSRHNRPGWLSVLIQAARRLHRGFVLVGVALIITTTVFGVGLLGGSDSKNHAMGRFATNLESYGSDWRKPTPSFLIPPKIWQISLPKSQGAVANPAKLQDTLSWLAKNTDYA